MTVRDALVLNHNIGRETLTGRYAISHQTQRRGDRLRHRGITRIAVFQCKEVHIEHVVLQELHDPPRLLIEAVELRDNRVRTQPAMGRQLAFLRSRVRRFKRFALHVTRLAGRNRIFDIEGQRRLLREGRTLPLVVERDSALPLVVVQRTRQRGLVAGATEL